MFRSLIFISFMLFGLICSSFAQTRELDSLKLIVKTSKVDTLQIKVAIEIGDKTRNNKPDTADIYFNYSLKLIEIILKQNLTNKIKNRLLFFNANALHGLGVINYNKSNHIVAEQLYEQSLSLRQEIGDKEGIANSLNNLANIYTNQGNYTKALKNYFASLKIMEVTGNKKGSARSFGNIGMINIYQGNYPEALKNLFASLKIMEETGDKNGIANCLNWIGNIYNEQGNYPQAHKNYLASLKIMEELGNKGGIANSLGNIGRIYNAQGNYPEALKNYLASLKKMEELGDKIGITNTLANIGNTYDKQGNYPEALKNHLASLKIRQEIGDKKGISISLHSIGCNYSNQGNYPEALKNLLASLKIKEEIGDKKGIAISLNGIGYIYIKTGKAEEGKKIILQSLQLSNMIGALENIKSSYSGLAQADSALGNFPSAFENYKLYIIYRDSLLNEENSKKIVQQQMQYEHAKTTALQKAAFEKTQDSLKLVNERKMALQALDFEYAQKQAQAKSEEERQQLIFEEEIKRNQIESDYKQKQNALKAEQERKVALAKAEQEKKDVLAREEKEKQRLILWSVCIGLLLVLVFAVFMYNRFKLTQKQKTIIEQQKEEVDKQRELADSRRAIAEEQKEIIENQKHLVEEKQKEILDSINYAKRIQYTLLAHEEFLKQNLNDHFTFFNPKDVVSGDFYWATFVGSEVNKKFYLAVCDSTGHGVPGAFMSLLNIGFLGEAINEKGIEKPNEVFEFVRKKLTETISKEGQKDGFDGILLCADKSSGMITYAAANNAPVLVRNNELTELSNDRMPVGVGERKDPFELFTIKQQKGDMIYLYTDGYPDQFGGPKGKKFKYKQLNELLLANANLPLAEQRSKLKSTFDVWKGDLEQVDDVTVIGIRI